MNNQSTPEKILVVGPSWVGDMIMAQTLFQCLKDRNPDCIIDVLAPAHSAPVVERMPQVRRLIDLPVQHKEIALGKRYRIGKQLRSEKYDQAIIMPRSVKSALVPFFAKIPKRTGWIGECRFGLLNDARRLNKKAMPLCVQRFAAHAFAPNEKLPEKLPLPALKTTQASIDNTLAQLNITLSEQKILALCPGAAFGPAKRWPAEHYARVAQEKLQQGWAVWLFGSAAEKPQTQQIQQACNNACRDFAGELVLTQTIELFSCVDAVIANDSGLMHIAAAMTRPLVVVYGSTSPRFTPPLSNNVDICSLNLSCSPCFKRECPLGHLNCLVQLEPQRVLQGLDKVTEAACAS